MRFVLLSMLIVALGLTSCQKNADMMSKQEQLHSSEDCSSDAIASLIKLVNEIWEIKPTASYEEVESFVWDKFGNQISETKSDISYEVSQYAFEVLSQMQIVNPSDYMTKDNYIASLNMIIDTNADNLTEYEKNALYLTVIVSSEIIELKYGGGTPLTKAEWWDNTKAWVERQWDDWGKCAAGIVGGAGGGFLGGAAAGSAVPWLGTVVGGVVGGISGGLGGAAAAC